MKSERKPFLGSVKMIVLLILAFSFCQSYAQEHHTIAGKLGTKNGTAVAFASIVVMDLQGKVIVFKTSDVNGAFALQIANVMDLDSLSLEINHLGFKKVHRALTRGTVTYDILMEEQAIDLADVKVKGRPFVSRMGDTLFYDVGSFAKNEDRSIGDVVKRLPGMEVSENGQIKFNGQNISHFYIDGDDLLDDKYAIGTKTIPYAMVKGVEVLQNHQPLKVLKNRAFSDKVAVNLVIKDEAKLKLTGQAKLGVGLPRQYDGEVNSVLFNKKYKMLNVMKGNNVGHDLLPDFEGYNSASFLSGMGNSRPVKLLSSGTAGAPDLPKSRYYLNHSGSVNANNLVNFQNGLQVKSNVKMLLDKNERSYYSQTELYAAADTIRYRERQDIDNHPFIMDVSMNAQSNKETSFFNNSLKVAYSKETGYSSLQSNEMDIGQQLHNRIRDFSNTLEYVPERKNNDIVNINWYLNYFNQPQRLFIQPGINAPVLNDGNAFESLDQFAEIPTWFNRVTVGYRFAKGMVKQRYQLGMVNEFQELHSALTLDQLDGSQTPYQASRGNDLHWNRNRFFAEGIYEYKKGALESVLSVPLIIQRIAYKDDGFDLNESKNQLLVNPALRMKYRMDVEDYLSFNYRFTNDIGNINGVFRGVVLNNYRTLSANNAALQEQGSHNIDLGYHFRRSLSMLFINAGTSYKRTRSNAIASHVVSDNISQTVLLPLVNDVTSLSSNIGISKFVFALGATANLNASWTHTRFNQLFNNELLPFNDISFVLRPGIEARIWNTVNLNYSGTAIWTTSKPLQEENEWQLLTRHIRNLDQSLGVSYAPYKNTFLRISGRHQLSMQPHSQVNYLFTDVHAGYKITRLNVDIALDVTNLTNITSYETYGIYGNSFAYNQYQLRGRMAVLKCIFNL